MGQAAEVIVEQLVLALVGLSAGAAVAVCAYKRDMDTQKERLCTL